MRKPRKIVSPLDVSESSLRNRKFRRWNVSWRRRTARREERRSIDRRGSGEIEIAATFRFVFSRPVARACVTRISSFYHLAARLKFARLFHQCKLRTQRWEMQRVGGKTK